MKSSVRSFISGVLVTLVFFSMVGTAFATKGKRTVDIDYNDIQVTLDGQTVALVDANGNSVEPFSINGTTYLPVRAVASALGLEVGWEQETSTVILNKKDTRPQRNGFDPATNQNINLGGYIYSVPQYFVLESGKEDESGEYISMKNEEGTVFMGVSAIKIDDTISPDMALEQSDNAETIIINKMAELFGPSACTILNKRDIQTENGIKGRLWDFSLVATENDMRISAKGSLFALANAGNKNLSIGGFFALDFSEHSYEDDFAKILSSVKIEATSNETVNPPQNTGSSGDSSSTNIPSGGSTSGGTKTPTQNGNDMPNGSQMVYVTPTGKRYHYDSTCNGGRYSLTTLEEAQRRGLTPCQKCVLH